MGRVLDNQRRTPREASPLTLPELFGHLTSTAFGGLEKAGQSRGTAAEPSISARRRALQRLTVAHLSELVLTPERGTPPEATQVARATLSDVRTRIRKVTANPERRGALDDYSRSHLQDLDAAISRALEARVELKAGG